MFWRIKPMLGTIKTIIEHKTNHREFGFISGEDGKEYYFDGSCLSNNADTYDFYEGDVVDFEPLLQDDGRLKARNVTFISEKKDLVENTISSPKSTQKTTIEKESTNIKNEPLIDFYKDGYSKNITHEKIISVLNSKEQIVLEKLKNLFYVTYINNHDMGGGNYFPFCLFGATEFTKQFIRGKYEFLVVFSYFKNRDWQHNTLKVNRFIRQRREIADRRPLVNFYILISNARTLKQEIDKIKGGTDAAVIPFSFEEIISNQTTEELKILILSRFEEYFFENNMLGEKSPIEDDNLLFGDRGKIADSIVQRCKENKHSGVFGLRRSGKSSVLKAVMRRLDTSEIKYVFIESRSELENLDSWKTALYDIAFKINCITKGIEQRDNETRAQFEERAKPNSSESDYSKRPTACFVEDVKLYTRNEQNFVIAIDEIELITYNTASTIMWQNLDSYKGFWGALRDSGCSIIVCGVNSTINEKGNIVFKGQTCDNPMYERIHDCSGYDKTYLPTFTDDQTKEMINTLGGYSNIAFDNVYVAINRAFGGQPYAIRQFCSYVFDNVKQYRRLGEIYQVSIPTFDGLVESFKRSSSGIALFETILQHVETYPDEYNMLKKIAIAPESNRKIDKTNVYLIDHLVKYGLIEFDSTTNYISFTIEAIREFICQSNEKDPKDMNNDERRRYVQDKVAECERKLKEYIKSFYQHYPDNERKPIIKKHVKSYGISIDTCRWSEVFDHKKFEMYFSSIKDIIADNWSKLGEPLKRAGIDKARFITCMKDLNAGRTDADHYDALNNKNCPDDWEITDQLLEKFIVAYKTLNDFFVDAEL